eukprot:403343161
MDGVMICGQSIDTAFLDFGSGKRGFLITLNNDFNVLYTRQLTRELALLKCQQASSLNLYCLSKNEAGMYSIVWMSYNTGNNYFGYFLNEAFGSVSEDAPFYYDFLISSNGNRIYGTMDNNSGLGPFKVVELGLSSGAYSFYRGYTIGMSGQTTTYGQIAMTIQQSTSVNPGYVFVGGSARTYDTDGVTILHRPIVARINTITYEYAQIYHLVNTVSWDSYGATVTSMEFLGSKLICFITPLTNSVLYNDYLYIMDLFGSITPKEIYISGSQMQMHRTELDSNGQFVIGILHMNALSQKNLVKFDTSFSTMTMYTIKLSQTIADLYVFNS